MSGTKTPPIIYSAKAREVNPQDWNDYHNAGATEDVEVVTSTDPVVKYTLHFVKGQYRGKTLVE